jgi:hypothetical protein
MAAKVTWPPLSQKNSKRFFSPGYISYLCYSSEKSMIKVKTSEFWIFYSMGFRLSEISWKRPQHYGCHMAQHWKGKRVLQVIQPLRFHNYFNQISCHRDCNVHCFIDVCDTPSIPTNCSPTFWSRFANSSFQNSPTSNTIYRTLMVEFWWIRKSKPLGKDGINLIRTQLDLLKKTEMNF